MTTEQELASFVSELELDDIPPDVAERGRLVIADTLGAIVGGSRDPAVRSLVQLYAERTTGTTTVLGTEGIETVPHLAAFCNGAAGTVLELDEGHRFAAGHPAIHVLPGLLAEAESEYGNGTDFLTSFVAGYEVAVRVARAMQPLQSGYHPHGVWGAVGGAASIAHHRGYGIERTLGAMTIAANYAQHTRFEAATEGATVRNGYAGMSNLASLLAADQAEAGFTGLSNGIESHLSLATREGFNAEVLVENLGSSWEIERGYFKIHAACRYTHAVLDAVATLQEELSIEEIEAVTVGTYPAAAQLDEKRPENALQAKFSIPFAVATALVSGETGPAAFDGDAITPETKALAEQVSVVVDETLAAKAPEQRGAHVTIKTASGTEEETVIAARGGEHRPFSEAAIESKFKRLTEPVIGTERGDSLWEAARALEAPRVLCTLAQR